MARLALERGVRTGRPPAIDLVALAPALHEPGASFVTLERRGALRGCIGSLEPVEPLALSVAGNAVKAARDPRLPPVAASELPDLEVKISVLSPLAPFPVASEAELVEALRPGVDGLVLRDGPHGATFLPSVWASLPSPRDFVRELKRKALLPDGHWSDALVCWRYTVEEIV
ncbi:MAG: AmmeMemoRadiSam system protein A [Myxococcota bacterium]|nr:AmmeMemoRadiSam system protein A [Myxococcota bacterium]